MDTLFVGFSRQMYSLNPERVVPSAKYQVLLALGEQPTASEPPFGTAPA
jgi:hypothetical protein